MSTDRNLPNEDMEKFASLLDWDMSTDRNNIIYIRYWFISLLDWDMSTDRNSCGQQRFCWLVYSIGI